MRTMSSQTDPHTDPAFDFKFGVDFGSRSKYSSISGLYLSSSLLQFENLRLNFGASLSENV